MGETRVLAPGTVNAAASKFEMSRLLYAFGQQQRTVVFRIFKSCSVKSSAATIWFYPLVSLLEPVPFTLMHFLICNHSWSLLGFNGTVGVSFREIFVLLP
jgi:hypothetical protein